MAEEKTSSRKINNDINKVLGSLVDGAGSLLTSKTVVGEPITVDGTIIIPMSDVTIGAAAGSNSGKDKDGGAGGFSAKMTPTAVLIIKDGFAKVVNIRDQNTITHVVDMVPQIIDRIKAARSGAVSDEEAKQAAFPEEAAAESTAQE